MMTRLEVWFLHVSTILTAVSGIVFAWMKYFMTTDDPFAVANHPWQPFFLDSHVVAAPFLLFAIGIIYKTHIWRKFRYGNGARRTSGVAMMILTIPMVLSGYLLQASAGELMRKVMLVIHLVSSGVFVAGYAAHQFSRKKSSSATAFDSARRREVGQSLQQQIDPFEHALAPEENDDVEDPRRRRLAGQRDA
jgi:hypothetical protein